MDDARRGARMTVRQAIRTGFRAFVLAVSTISASSVSLADVVERIDVPSTFHVIAARESFIDRFSLRSALDLSRFCYAPDGSLGHFTLEGDRAFTTHG
ncbi:MAG: hypothetical protein ACFB2Z_13745 [Maricaulaceae bacterium]